VTDGETDAAQQQRPRYAKRRAGKNSMKESRLCYRRQGYIGNAHERSWVVISNQPVYDMKLTPHYTSTDFL